MLDIARTSPWFGQRVGTSKSTIRKPGAEMTEAMRHRGLQSLRTDRPLCIRPEAFHNQGDTIMAKGQQRGNREARKPKKTEPPKQNASNPSLKGAPATQPLKSN